MMKQINGEPQVSQSCGYILGYARVQKSDVEGMRIKFLKNIGGQFHVQCERHKLPLICSTVPQKGVTSVIVEKENI